jgi:hypothetical protein
MDRIIVKSNVLSQDSNLIPLVRWLFPECQIHIVPSSSTPRQKAQDHSSISAAVAKANLDA